MTSPVGGIFIPYPAWPPAASGLSLYLQYTIKDPTVTGA